MDTNITTQGRAVHRQYRASWRWQALGMGLLVGGLMASATPAMADRTYANVPLFWASGAKPNVMLALDTSKSMDSSPKSGGPKKVLSMQNVARQVVTDNVANMNIGIFTFKQGGSYAEYKNACGSTLSALTTTIDDLDNAAAGSPATYTPLGSQAYEVMRYFRGMSATSGTGGATSYTSPIQYRCQKNFMVVLTDGVPTKGIEDGDKLTPAAPADTDTGGVTNPWGNYALDNTSNSWDGFPDTPKITGEIDGYYQLTDDMAQFGYDIDMRTVNTPATSGCASSALGKDCAGKSWDDPKFSQQNVTTYVIGFDLENEMLRDTPLVNRKVVLPADVNTDEDTVKIEGHGLSSGDYVTYYASRGNFVMKGLGNTGTDTVTVSNGISVPSTGTPVTYSSESGTSLEYKVTHAPTVTNVTTTVAAGSNNVNISTNQFTASTANMTVGTVVTHTTAGTSSFRYLDTNNTNSPTISTGNIGASANTVQMSTTNLVVGSRLTYRRGGTTAMAPLADNSIVYVQSCGTTTTTTTNSLATATVGASCPSGTNYIKLTTTPPVMGSPSGAVLDITGTGNSNQYFTYQKALPDVNSKSTSLTYYVKQIVDATHFTLSLASGGAELDVVGFGGSGAASAAQTFTWSYSTPNPDTFQSDTSYYVINTGSNTFKLATSVADATAVPAVAVDISNGGNPNQTFTYEGNLTTIGGLYPYEKDTPPDSTPSPATESAARGKYCVKVIDDNNVQLSVANAGGSPVCDTRAPKTAASATYSSNTTTSGGVITTSSSHGFETGDAVTFTCSKSGCYVAGTSSSNGITNNTSWYIAKISNNTFKLATSEANATACAAGTTASCKSLGGTDKFGSNHTFSRAAIFGFTKLDLTSQGNGVFSVGPGKSYFSSDEDALSAALNAAFLEIDNASLSASAVAANSSEFTTGNFIYQARFNTSDWSGDLKAFTITDAGVNITSPAWEASKTVKASGRKVLTCNDSLALNACGRTFAWDNVSNAQKQYLSGSTTTNATTGDKVIGWLKGTDQTADAAFRIRSRGILGDVINSSPAFVGANNDEGYATITTGGGSYASYVSQKASLRPGGMLFFGANDGMVHGLNGSTGEEKVAYIPKGVYFDWADANDNGVMDGSEAIDYKLYKLTQKFYGQGGNPHRYFADGSPTVGDAYLNGQWTTVVVGGLNAGGRTVYALDARDDDFDNSSVLWEFSHPQLGYTFSKPVVGKLENGTWVAIFGNGYDSAGDRAQLFVVNLYTGALIQKIDTGAGTNNGLSSPAALLGGADGKSITAVYAGDLHGTVWRFGFNSTTGNGTASRLFEAGMPITAQPAVESYSGGTLVHIGTGKYFETGDKSTTTEQNAMYTIYDDGSGSTVSKGSMVEQTITGTSGGFFTVSQHTVSYPTQKGWYINFAANGERNVSEPVVIGPRLLFTTLIPSEADQCQGGGSSRFFELNSTSGAMINKEILDTNGDGDINEDDDIVAGMVNDDGIWSKPNVQTKNDSGGSTLVKVFGSTSQTSPLVTVENAAIDCSETNSCAERSPGRMSWRQLK